MFLNAFKNLFTSKTALKKGIRRRLELLGLEDRIVPAVPFSPSFPNALSINAPGSSVTNSASFTVTFNQPVIGVDAADFNLIATGSVANGTISSVTGSGATFTVNVTGITGSGTLGVDLVSLPTITALPSFAAKQDFATGTSPNSVTLGDVNGDGKLDLVTTNNNSNGSVSVLLGNGDGTFQAQQTFATGSFPYSVTLGDVNGDGRLDIINASGVTNKVSVLLGNGNGTFQTQQPFATGTFPRSVTLGDVNGDGKIDLITANNLSNNASVLLGNGNGTFQAQQTFTTGAGPTSVTLGDVNGDGKLDIITANATDDTTSVLLGNGNGTFQAQQTFATGDNPQEVTLGDVNSDGRLDIITANRNSNNASVLLGNGDGTFQTQATFATGSSTCSVTLGDVNGDGKLDIITANLFSANASVLLGNGDGTFATQATFATGTNPRSVTLGDVNGDGRLDIVIPNNTSANASVLLGTGGSAITVTFTPQQTFATGDKVVCVILGDVNRDGILDIVTADETPNNVSVLLGNGNGTFQAQQTFAVGKTPVFVTMSDVNGDGILDIITANRFGNNVSVLLGNGNGTFQPQQTFATGDFPGYVVLGDINADGLLDIITANFGDNVSVLLGNGNGTFQGQQTFAAGTGPASVALGDFNGDGRLDMVTANFKSANVSVLLNSISFTGQTTTVQNSVPTPTAPLVVGTPPPTSSGGSSTVTLYDPVTGAETGTAVPFPGFSGPIKVVSGDFNNDGVAEIIAGAGFGGGPAIAILDSQTGEVLEAFFAFDQAFTGGVFVAVQDVNGDGILDIIAGAGPSGGPEVRIFDGSNLNVLRSFYAYAEDFSGGVSVASIDFNNDGILDIVTGAGPGGAPHVKVFDGATNAIISQWYAYPVSFTGGVFVAAGDIGNDGNIEVVTGAGQGGTPVVAVWDPYTGALLAQFMAYAEDFTGGVRVGINDGNSDGIADILTGAGPGGGPQVNVFSFPALDLLFSFYSGEATNAGGVFVS